MMWGVVGRSKEEAEIYAKKLMEHTPVPIKVVDDEDDLLGLWDSIIFFTYNGDMNKNSTKIIQEASRRGCIFVKKL